MTSEKAPNQGLAEFWDCLDPKAKTALRRVQKDAILDQVMCANCRVLVTDATTSLEQVAKQPTKAKSRHESSGLGSSSGSPAPPLQSPLSSHSKSSSSSSSSSSTIVLNRGADGKFVCTGGRFGDAPLSPPPPSTAATAGRPPATAETVAGRSAVNSSDANTATLSGGRQPPRMSNSGNVDPATGLRPLAEFSGAGSAASAAFLLLDESALVDDFAALTAATPGSGSTGCGNRSSSSGSGSSSATKKNKGKNAKSPAGSNTSSGSLELAPGGASGSQSMPTLAAVAARAARLSSLSHHHSAGATSNALFPPSSPSPPTRKVTSHSSFTSVSSTSLWPSASSLGSTEPDKGVVAPLGAKAPLSAYGLVRKPCVGKPGSVIVCCGYCFDKLKLKVVDTLTYPRPVKQFQLLVDGATTLGALKDLLLTEVDAAAELKRDEVVLRARGKALEAAHDDWSLDALGLLNHQQVVISRTLGKGSSDVDGSDGSSGSTSANEAARKGSEEKNKQFVGDLLFGHTSPGFGFLSGGNSSDSTGLGNNGSIGGGCLGGALNSHGGSSNGGGSGGGGVSVRDLYRVKHGLQLLSNGLRLEVQARVYSAWRAEETARQHENDLLQLLLDDDQAASDNKFSTPTAKGKKSPRSSKKGQKSEANSSSSSSSSSSNFSNSSSSGSDVMASDFSSSSYTSPTSSKGSAKTPNVSTPGKHASGDNAPLSSVDSSGSISSDAGTVAAAAPVVMTSPSGAGSSKKAKGKEKEKEKDKRKKEAAAAAKREAAGEAQRAAAAEGRRLQALEVVEQRRREEAQWAKEQQQRHAQDDAEQTARALAAIASAEAAEEERRCSQKQEKEEQPSLQGQASVMGVASAVGDTGATVPLSANPRTHASTQFSNLDTAKTNAWPDREQQQEHQVQQQQQQQQQQQHAHTSSLQVAPDSSFPAAVSQPRFCHQCGGGLLAGSKFCSSCGAQVVLAVAPPPPPLSPSVISPPLMQRHLPTSPSSTVATAATGGGRAYATQLSLRAFLSDDTMLTGGASSSNANHMDASLSSPLAFLSLGELPVENNSLGGVGSGALGGMAPAALGGGALFGGLDNRNLGVQSGPGNNGENRLSFFQFLDDDDDESNENTGIGP